MLDARSLAVRLGTALEMRIQGMRGSLSDKEQAVANFLLTDPKEFVSLSISAIASRCGVSETVIIRLYRKLGYDGFHQFKIDIAQSLTAPAVEGLGALKSTDGMETIMRKVLAVSRQAMEDAVHTLDPVMLGQARDALLGAKRVIVAALGGSAAVGFDLVHKLLKIGVVSALMTDSHMQAMAASILGPGDVLVAISHSGNSRDIIEALLQAKQQGATTVLITGFPKSPAAQAAHICIDAICRESKYQTDAMTSRMVQIAIVDTLYVSLIFANKERALSQIHATSKAAARKKL